MGHLRGARPRSTASASHLDSLVPSRRASPHPLARQRGQALCFRAEGSNQSRQQRRAARYRPRRRADMWVETPRSRREQHLAPARSKPDYRNGTPPSGLTGSVPASASPRRSESRRDRVAYAPSSSGAGVSRSAIETLAEKRKAGKQSRTALRPALVAEADGSFLGPPRDEKLVGVDDDQDRDRDRRESGPRVRSRGGSRQRTGGGPACAASRAMSGARTRRRPSPAVAGHRRGRRASTASWSTSAR
jgi:hypothetical protein